MDMATLITEVLQDEEGIDPLDTYYTELRAEIARRVSERSDDLWVSNDWPWKKGFAAVSVTGGTGAAFGVGTLPSDMQAFGHQMSVTVNGVQRPPLRWRPLNEIQAERATWAATVAYPLSFSIQLESTLGVKQIFLSPFFSNNQTLNIVYDKMPPVLTDSVAPSGLEQWPIAYHRSVFKAMVTQEMMRKKGDVRADTSQEAKVRAKIAEMTKAEQPGRGAVQRMPVFPGARRHYGRWLILLALREFIVASLTS